MSRLLGRAAAIFFEAAEPATRESAPPAPAPGDAHVVAAVVGAAAAVVPVAAACAGELRARAAAAAALICIWRLAPAPEPEPGEPAARSPAGATTPGAKRLAARLAAHDLGATACGRLAWLALDTAPIAAAAQFRRCRSIAGVPIVLAVAGPRPEPFESLLAELELCVAVLASDTDPALRELALARLPARRHAIAAPLPPGPPRWAAMAGLARLRSLTDVAP